MIKILIFLLFPLIIFGNVYNITNVYDNIQSYKHYFKNCTCNFNQSTSPGDNATELYYNVPYYYNDYTLIKVNVITCSSLNIDTNYDNEYSYSFDLINWIYTKGFTFICSQSGNVYFNISKGFKIYRFDTTMQTSISKYMIPNETFIYNYSITSSLGLYFKHNCSSNMKIEIRYKMDDLELDYIIYNHFSFNHSIYNQSDLIMKIFNNNNVTCYMSIYFSFTNDLYISNYSSNALFYNNKSIDGYDFIISENDETLPDNGIIRLNGYYSLIPSYINLYKINEESEYYIYNQILTIIYNSEYDDLNKFIFENITGSIMDILTPFTPLLINRNESLLINITTGYHIINDTIIYSELPYYIFNIYPYENIYLINSTDFYIVLNNITYYYNEPKIINITSQVNFITIENSEIKLNNSNQSIIISNSSIILDENVSIGELLIDKNLIIFIKNDISINVNGCVNFSGNLTINYEIDTNINDKISPFKYNCYYNKFDNIIIRNNNSVIKHCDKYLQSNLQILFEECENEDVKNSNWIIIATVIPIAIVTVIIVIVLLSVKYFREKIFPHSKRTNFLHKAELNPQS